MTDTRYYASTMLMGCIKDDQITVVSDRVFSVGGDHV